ncbi:Capsular polysaccharide biosynthesis protein [Streptomyces sp. Ag82_O1-12]|uniref:hypothetical protein n=1 Tax=unclassified Streptomyces TaxID=2593676 RepID=UPI000BC71439|nr:MULTISPECIES: hypothetical protein [unclassified Streptomyces]SMQ20649.1 Capsular polysaccharide biosynthesis protein [Streptomyces sp. Ag82_O1-12]SOD49407.1 Capsular polysaccharide biosynthesis protein [Streptomyces sp. Ag82_G6-1]
MRAWQARASGGSASRTGTGPDTADPDEAAAPGKSGPAGFLSSGSPRRRGLLAALLAGLIVLGAGLVVVEQLPTRYSTTSTISFAPRSLNVVDADVVELIANKYSVVAGATATVDSAADTAGVTPKQLRDTLSATVEPNTGNLNISVSLGNARQAAVAANSIANTVNRAAGNDRLIAGEITARADPTAAQLKPSRTLLRVVVVAAALLVAGWVGFAVRQLSRRAGKET